MVQSEISPRLLVIVQYVRVLSLLSVVVLQIDQVIFSLQSSVNQQGLLWSVCYVATIVVRKQINFQSAFIRSERSSCFFFFFRFVGELNQTSTRPHSQWDFSHATVVQYVCVQSLLAVVVLQIDQVILCLWSSVNQQRLLWNVYYVATIVVRKQIHFQSVVLRSKRSSCFLSHRGIRQKSYRVPAYHRIRSGQIERICKALKIVTIFKAYSKSLSLRKFAS